MSPTVSVQTMLGVSISNKIFVLPSTKQIIDKYLLEDHETTQKMQSQ